jgi:hypothetical protein
MVKALYDRAQTNWPSWAWNFLLASLITVLIAYVGSISVSIRDAQASINDLQKQFGNNRVDVIKNYLTKEDGEKILAVLREMSNRQQEICLQQTRLETMMELNKQSNIEIKNLMMYFKKKDF